MNPLSAERLLGRIFLFLLVGIVSFLALDWLSTPFLSSRSAFERRFPAGDLRQPRPYTMFGGRPGAADLNALGYRGKVPAMPKPTGEFRVIMLGGSTVFEGDPPIAGLIEELFHAQGVTRAQVYNFGVVSSVSGMELSRLLFEAVDFSPDLVLLYNGANDLLHPFTWDPRPGYPFNFIAYERNPLLESDVSRYPALAMFAYGSNLARRLFPSLFVWSFTQLGETRQAAGWGTDAWREAIAATYLDRLRKAHAVAGAFGAGFAAFFQPIVYFKKTLALEEADTMDDPEREHALLMRPLVRAGMGRLREEVPGLQLVDLSAAYDNTPDWVFTDPYHTRQEAKPHIAQAIFDSLYAGEAARSAIPAQEASHAH